MSNYILPGFNGVNALVVGDAMIDRYVWGSVDRISPEAPIPVVNISDRSSRLGGAANVAANLAGLGCNTTLLGVVGADDAGTVLRSILKEKGIEDACITYTEMPTTSKTRVVCRSQQLIRIDNENSNIFPDVIYEKLIHRFHNMLNRVDVVIMSDYAKGIFHKGFSTHCINECNRLDITTLVDPKMSDWNYYKGATCITPNQKEFNRLISSMGFSPEKMLENGNNIRQYYDIKYLIVTQGAQGMSLFHEDNEIITASTSAKKVFDVSGAGDTVLATIAACIATGLPIYQALELANIAAGVSVERVGTHAVTINELKNAIRLNNSTSYKNLSLAKDAAEIVNSWHNDGECIVFTNGCFDLFHAGHVKLLQNAKGEGSKLIIGLNSDDSVRRLKGIGRPIINQTDRAAVLTALDCVDLVVVFNEDTPIDLIKQFRPHVICKGSDYTKEEVIGQEIVESWGGKVILIPLVSDLSTTEILLRIHGSSEKSNPIIPLT